MAARLIVRNGSARGKQFRGRINENVRRLHSMTRLQPCNVAYCANQEQPFVNKLRSNWAISLFATKSIISHIRRASRIIEAIRSC